MEVLAETVSIAFHGQVATLAEIAVEAGVSEATVSRVLNDKPGVSESARQSVLVALDLLGYERPTRLRRRSSGLVGVVVPELENPIFPAFAQVIDDALSSRRYTPVLCTQSPGGISEDEYVESLLDHGVAGIIFVSGRHADRAADHERYRALIARGLPVVFVNGHAEELDAPFLSTDEHEAMTLAVSHLAELGHTRIGLAIGPRRYVPALRKREGFVAALVRAPGPPARGGRGLDRGGPLHPRGRGRGHPQAARAGATAVVCGSDPMALGAVRAVREAGRQVPRDVSVVGFDDSRLTQFFDPPLTTVRQPVQVIGQAAVAALADAIEGQPSPAHEYLFRPELVVRSTTGRAPTR